jgi:hypothetical protein
MYLKLDIENRELAAVALNSAGCVNGGRTRHGLAMPSDSFDLLNLRFKLWSPDRYISQEDMYHATGGKMETSGSNSDQH